MRKFFGKWFVWDIETTGLYADNSFLVAIGLKNKEKEKIFFVSKPSQEKEVILKFFEFLEKEGCEALIGYNILNFDFPYLQAKCLLHNLKWKNKPELIDLLEWTKKLRFKTLTLSHLSQLLFSNSNSKSLEIPKFYLYFLEGKVEYKEKIIEHLRKDLENVLLLAFKLEIVE